MCVLRSILAIHFFLAIAVQVSGTTNASNLAVFIMYNLIYFNEGKRRKRVFSGIYSYGPNRLPLFCLRNVLNEFGFWYRYRCYYSMKNLMSLFVIFHIYEVTIF